MTVVDKDDSEGDKTEVGPPPCAVSDRRVSRTHTEETTTYSDFRLLPDTPEKTTKWAGTARANVSYNGGFCTLEVRTYAPCYATPGSSGENGYETTTSGSGVAQGEVRFFRYTDQGSGKTTCHIEADVEKEVAKIPEVGRRWDSKGEQPVKQEYSLLAGSVFGTDFSFVSSNLPKKLTRS